MSQVARPSTNFLDRAADSIFRFAELRQQWEIMEIENEILRTNARGRAQAQAQALNSPSVDNNVDLSDIQASNRGTVGNTVQFAGVHMPLLIGSGLLLAGALIFKALD